MFEIFAQALGIFVLIFSLGALAFYLIPLAVKDLIHPRADTPLVRQFDSLRKTILILLVSAFTSIVPGVVYRVIVAYGYEPLWFQNVVRITSSLSVLAFIICLIILFKFKYTDY